MGTSTLFRRYNDFGARLASMTKKELDGLDKLSPWKEEKESVRGWSVLMELHNGNVEPLVWWEGRLFRLRDAPKLLAGKYYNRYTGKYTRESAWTILKGVLRKEIEMFDEKYKRGRRKSRNKKEK